MSGRRAEDLLTEERRRRIVEAHAELGAKATRERFGISATTLKVVLRDARGSAK